MITCIVIDDEQRALETFKKIAERYFAETLKILAVADSVKIGVEAIKDLNPDIVFLDIEMPVENGFKLFDYFEEVSFGVIFLTAYKHYAIDAIRHSALDYLLKPLDIDALRNALDRFEKSRDRSPDQAKIQTLISNLSARNESQTRIAFPTPAGYRMERIGNILYIQADENYSRVEVNEGEMILVSRTLKAVEEMLPLGHFFRIHKSFLVNLDFVKEYTRTDGHFVILQNGVSLEVATRRHEELLNTLTNRKG